MAKICNPTQGAGPVNAGEERLLKRLEVQLPDNYYIVPNGEYAHKNPQGMVQFWEYDCIVIAPHAIYHIENKDWAGQLYGDDFQWTINGHERPNPLRTAELKSKLLKSMLIEKNPEWRFAKVITLVTLSNPSQTKFGLDPNARSFDQIFTLNSDLEEFIKDADRAGKREDAIAEYQEAITNFLTGASSQRTAEEKTEILDYQIDEILQKTELFTEYLVHPRGIDFKHFKVREYSLSVAGLSPMEQQARKKKVENARNAQYHLSSSPYIIKSEYRLNEEGTYFYEVSEYMDDRTLKSILRMKTLTQMEKVKIIIDVANALKMAHDNGVFHRDVCPANIYILNDGTAALANFGKSWFVEHEEQKMDYTVRSMLAGEESPYTPPEFKDNAVGAQSDIYSLGVIIYELMVGKTPFNDTSSFRALGKFPDDLLPSHVKELPDWLDNVIKETIAIEPADRFEKVDELIEYITSHAFQTTDGSGAGSGEQTDQSKVFDLRDLKPTMPITRELVLGEELGKGGFGRVFKAKHIYMGKWYAAKLFDKSSTAQEIINEYEALKDLYHPNIVKFVYNGLSDQGLFFTLMELLDGESLSDYTNTKGDLRLPIDEIYKMATQLLDALVYMQDKGIFHRDIKPNNIVWDKRQRYVLIDFNISTALEDDTAFAGTRPYMAPDLIVNGHKVNWDNSADTFSLGVTLYELLAHSYPWSGSDPCPKINVAPTDIRVYNSSKQTLSEPFADFIMKSIVTDRTKRFTSAREMKEALETIGVNGLLKAQTQASFLTSTNGKVNEIDIVDYINSLYSQSRHGNAGTRASLNQSSLDELTYTETKLHRHLIKDIVAGKYKLVIITGNAGDGKTALIHEIEKKGENRQMIEGMNGARFDIGGVAFESNYDGSQDEADKLNDDVLRSFFHPFMGLSDYTQATTGRIIAINEGRLVDFLSTQDDLKVLHDNIDNYFYKGGKVDLLPGLMVINLNLRSVTARDENGESLLHSQIKKLTNPILWSKCESCPIKDRCFIKYNVNTFQDTNAGDEVINRLEWLVRTIVYKRELHITMRDLRSFIAFMLTRDYSCEQVKLMLEHIKADNMRPEFYWQFYYFNVTAPEFFNRIDTYFPFPTNESNDRLVQMLKETDIARVSLPAYDRDLYYKEKEEGNYLVFGERKQPLLKVFNEVGTVVPSYELSDNDKFLLNERHQSFIRHQYFEGCSDIKKFNFMKRLPYQNIKAFYDYLRNKTEEMNVAIMHSIAKAISRSEGCINSGNMIENYMLLSCTHVNDPLSKSYRVFNIEDFCIAEEDNKHLVEYLEYESDSFIFRHKNEQFIQLTVSLDLFEMLQYINNGFSPSINDMQGKFIELQIFKNLLESKTYNEILVTKNNKKFFVVRLNEDKTITIEPLNQQAL
ncbi:methylation-associated defense system protein kinase MAD6 [Phocaeicola abscessus]|uniref:methylation-associated defense system protein kinase MAD6 n=1 Tax=Phocaeicola abscessus TaxID=555313 RepID=UPI000560BFF6|nr:serine/threonine protein kinase [Phocaeicola abscessus]